MKFDSATIEATGSIPSTAGDTLDDLTLRPAMLLHDIGKPNCKSTNEKSIQKSRRFMRLLFHPLMRIRI